MMDETEYATSLSYANGLIQKQKETIDEQYHTISTSNIWNSKLKDRLDLALKSLEEISSMRPLACGWNSETYYDKFCECEGIVYATLSEISKLSKEREK